MTKQIIDEILSETNGEIIYIDQLIKILNKVGYSYEDINIIRKNYGKKHMDKVIEFENGLRNKVSEELAEYIIIKIRNNVKYMCYKIHEGAILNK